jgi:hypothetical protein
MKKLTQTNTTRKTKETAEKLFTLKTKLMKAIDTKIDENMTRIFFVSPSSFFK